MTLVLETIVPVISDLEMDGIMRGTLPHHEVLESQCPHPLVCALLALSATYVLRHCQLRDAWIVILAYFMTDLYMAVLHIYLDHGTTKASCPIPALKWMANQFQHHHDYPIDVLYMNHVGGISELNILTLGVPWLWRLAASLKGRSLPPQLHILALCSSCFGMLAAYNHVCMHMRTHHLPIPPAIEWCQNAGILPHNEFHRLHHTPPHDVNFAFLVGGSAIYDKLNTTILRILGEGPGSNIYYGIITFLFWLIQPFHVSSLGAFYYWVRGDGAHVAKQKSA